MDNRPIWTHFANRLGVISRGEATDFGLTPEQIKRRVAIGEWEEVAPRVYRHRAAPNTWNGRSRAAALSVDGLLGYRSAAAVWKMDGFGKGRIEVVVPEHRYRRRRGVIVHRSKNFDIAGATMRRGIPVTGPARTVLDVAAVIDDLREIGAMVDAALNSGLVTWHSLFSVLTRHSARGRDGCGRLRAVLDERYGEPAVPDSRWNRDVGHLLTDAGLPRPVFEYEIRHDAKFVGRVDLAYPERRVAIECDSVRHHLNRESFVADPRRRNRLLNAGWRVLTFTWSDYADRPRELTETVRAALLQL